MKSIVAIVIIVAVILFIMLCMGCFTPGETETEKDWSEIDSQIQNTKKLHEEETYTRSVSWDDCCDEEILEYTRVEFEHMWVFYFEEYRPEDDCCHNPVVWTVQDSLGRTVYSSSSCSPVNTFGNPAIITTGIWDCMNRWTVTVENGCLYPINCRWELTLYCYE